MESKNEKGSKTKVRPLGEIKGEKNGPVWCALAPTNDTSVPLDEANAYPKLNRRNPKMVIIIVLARSKYVGPQSSKDW